MLQFAFSSANVLSLKKAKSRVAFLSGLEPQYHDCCVNSCCCFVGPNEDLEVCPHCSAPHYQSNGRPQKQFTYVPVIPRLISMFQNPALATKMRYHAHDHIHIPGSVNDVFDGSWYHQLRATNVVINNTEMPFSHFSNPRDIALGLSTDGFAPFQRRKTTTWPLILFNYNLPREICFRKDYIICLGMVPGPKKPKDFDSFLWLLVEELLKLAAGVQAFDSLQAKLFVLRAYLIIVAGDIPAISMVMQIKGHNGYSPCQTCNITGVQVPQAKSMVHYVPLNQSSHPEICASSTAVKKFDPLQLFCCTHEEMMQQAQQVQLAPTTAEAETLAKEYGIKGIPVLSFVSSLSFLKSFPYDFMHLI